jgi:hypothetical protein
LPSLIFYCAIARKSTTCRLVSKIPTTANGDRPYTRPQHACATLGRLYLGPFLTY